MLTKMITRSSLWRLDLQKTRSDKAELRCHPSTINTIPCRLPQLGNSAVKP